MTNFKQNRSVFKAAFKQLHIAIKVLYWYSLPIGIASILCLLPPLRQWYKAAIPYPGWHPNSGYLTIAVVIYFSTFGGSIRSKSYTIRKYLVVMLGMIFLMGIIDWFAEDSKDYYFSNPYLTYNSLHITLGIGIPLFFLVVIGWLLMKNLVKKNQKASV